MKVEIMKGCKIGEAKDKGTDRSLEEEGMQDDDDGKKG